MAVILFIAASFTPWLIAPSPAYAMATETLTCGSEGGWHTQHRLWTRDGFGADTCSEEGGSALSCVTPALAGAWLLALLCALQQVFLGNRWRALDLSLYLTFAALPGLYIAFFAVRPSAHASPVLVSQQTR